MKVWLWTIVAIAVLTGAIVGAVFWNESRTSKRLSQETEAVGLVATPTKWYDSGDEETVEGHTLTYAYVVDGQVYTRTLQQITWYDAAVRYKVCHAPGDGDESRLYPAEHRCGS